MKTFSAALIAVLILCSSIHLSAFGFVLQQHLHLSRTRSTAPRMIASIDSDQYEIAKSQLKTALAKSFSAVEGGENAGGGQDPAEQRVAQMLGTFLDDYCASCQAAHVPAEVFTSNLVTFFKEVRAAIKTPYTFQPLHSAVVQPFNYYKWGNDFLRPLVIDEQSRIVGLENAQKIKQIVDKGEENVVILSNHQTEADPQVLSILLEKAGLAELAERIVFIAGHKVTSDPVAVPFSMGRNLLCIHSKKHIRNPPEAFEKKQAQNMMSMAAMNELIAKGGNVFWVAPSGGRDRPAPPSPSPSEGGRVEDGVFETAEGDGFVVSPFDFKALDMFKLMSMQSRKAVRFFPMAMYTHQLVPPPKEVSSSLGEERSAKRGAVSVAFLPETDGIGGLKDKEFTKEVQTAVEAAYADLCAWHATAAAAPGAAASDDVAGK